MTWIDFAERLGLPAGLLMVVLAAAGRACSWIGTEVVVPLRDRHLAFLDRTEQLLEVIAVVAASTITNYVGSVAQPALEAPFDAFAWHARAA